MDKDFVFDRWTLTSYLDLMNATNRRNLEMVTPSVDYTEASVYGLPIITAFGVKGMVTPLLLLADWPADRDRWTSPR